MRAWGRGFTTAVDPYCDNPPDEDGDVVCGGCGAVFPGLDELRAAGLSTYPERCRECRAETRAADLEAGARTAREVRDPTPRSARAHAPAATR